MRKISFNEDWICNGVPVNLPHDAQILEKREPEGNGGHGYFPGGIYTYEKSFEAPSCWEGKRVIAEFEGVYKNATVSLNGERLTFHPYGYTTFTAELKGLRYGEKNTLTVEADNSKLPNSRWYSGAGIYRPVWLYIGGEGDIAYRGVKITTLSIRPAKIRVETTVCGGQASVGEISVEILDGEKVMASGAGADCELAVPDAGLWSEESPKLYTCRVSTGGDAVEEKFGIREITWSNKGLFINGKETLLRGGCIHHDNGILGAATYDESEWRRVRILKEAGFNALRASHNPASRALLEACDFYGMYVMDETFDMWYNRKNKYDYGCDFEKYWREDTAEMVARDYNHPSVIMYSIGNEVAEPSQEKGLQYAKKMAELCRRMDKTRPVTCGLNLMIMSRAVKGNGIYQDGEMDVKADTSKQKKQDGKQNASLAFNIMASFIGSGMNNAANSAQADKIAAPVMELLDIAGYNYASGRYKKDGQLHPDRVIFGSETFPQDICKNWEMVKEYPYLVGDFMWTAWDYLGEAGLGAWSYTGGMPFNRPYPWVLAGTGVIDICGTPDGSCRYASTVWGLEKAPRIAVKPVNHPGERVSKSVWRGTNAIESWSWNGCDGNRAEVEVYSDSASVALLLNGKTVGKKKIKDCKAVFKTGYAPGTLTAVAYSADGRELGKSSLSSASGRIKICAAPEQDTAKSGQVVYIPVTLEGENGVVESNQDRALKVSVKGGRLLGFGSANPCTEEQYHTGTFTTWYGRALAVVRVEEDCTLTVTDGKERVEASIKKIAE